MFSVNVVLSSVRVFQALIIQYLAQLSLFLAMIVLFLYWRDSVLVSNESFDCAVPDLPLPTGQEILAFA